MKRLFFVLFVQMAALSLACAQELVPRLRLEAYDLTAQSQPRVDLNGRKCALVKVLFVGDIVGVDGNIVGETVHHTNELWVYMPKNSMHLKVVTKDYLPLMVAFPDYGIEGLESGMTYVLALAKPGEGATTSPTAALSGSPSVTISPEAEAYLDGYISGQSAGASPSGSSSSVALSGNTITIPVNDNVNIEMVRVEAGSFMMGAGTDNRYDTVHHVTLTKDFYLGKYEVTQALWQVVMGSNPSKFKGDNLPVEQVSWDDCQEFIQRLNTLTGYTFRLPIEAEWEYAARGGKKSHGYKYGGSNDINDVAWYRGNSDSKTHVVGMKQANELGLYDMTGNVAEWCEDWWYMYGSSPQENPLGIGDMSDARIGRGGCWRYFSYYCRVFDRLNDQHDSRSAYIGLRLCLSE